MGVNITLEVFTLHFRCVTTVKKSAFYYAFESFKDLCLSTITSFTFTFTIWK